MSDKSVCDVSIGEETVDARAPNFAFLSLMNVGPMGPALARGGKLTLARCVWYPGPGLMEKACFHSCQSHLLSAAPHPPSLHTRTVKTTTTSPSLSLLCPGPAPRQFVFVILWTRLGGNHEQKQYKEYKMGPFPRVCSGNQRERVSCARAASFYAHGAETPASYEGSWWRGGWRVALLIGMSGGGLIDGLIACSPSLERGSGRGGEERRQGEERTVGLRRC